jgi:hypothetical protein
MNNVLEYRELSALDDFYTLELVEFVRTLLNSRNTDNPIEIKYGTKKIKINNNLLKTRLAYVANALLENEVREDLLTNFPDELLKDFYFKSDLVNSLESYNDALDKSDLSMFRIGNSAKELYNNKELDLISNIVQKEGCFQETKFSKQKKDLIKKIIIETNFDFRELGLFNNELKTISTNEACFLYDVYGYANFFATDMIANNQEKYQFIKRYLKD